MTRRKLPLDPFDPKTPYRADYQIGNFGLMALILGTIISIWLLADADWSSARAIYNVAAAIGVLAGTIWIARALFRSI